MKRLGALVAAIALFAGPAAAFACMGPHTMAHMYWPKAPETIEPGEVVLKVDATKASYAGRVGVDADSKQLRLVPVLGVEKGPYDQKQVLLLDNFCPTGLAVFQPVQFVVGRLETLTSGRIALDPRRLDPKSPLVTEALRESAAAGSTLSMLWLAKRLGPSDEGLRWLTTAAEAGSEEAMFELAGIYKRGGAVTPDPEKAQYWLDRRMALQARTKGWPAK